MAVQKIHTFQNAVTATGNGTECVINFSGSPDLMMVLAISGTATARTVIFEGKGEVGDYIAIQATNINSNASATQTTGTTDELWKVNLAGISAFRARVSAVSGGSLTVKGKIIGN